MSSSSDTSSSTGSGFDQPTTEIEHGSVAAFVAAWKSGADPPEIAEYLPDARSMGSN